MRSMMRSMINESQINENLDFYNLIILRYRQGLPTNIGGILIQKYLYTFSWRKVSSTKAGFDEYFLNHIQAAQWHFSAIYTKIYI